MPETFSIRISLCCFHFFRWILTIDAVDVIALESFHTIAIDALAKYFLYYSSSFFF